MAATAALVGGSFLSAFLQVLFDRLASRNFLSFCKGQSLNDKLLKKLLTLLNSVNGLLDDAEEKEIIKPSVEKWLNDLKDAVYEADDLLDEIGYESLKLESESRIQTNPRKVWNNLLTSYNPFRKFIEEKLKDVLERLQDLVNQKDALGLREVGVGGGVKRASFHRIPSTSLVQECDVYGRDADKQAIIHWLLSDDPKGNDLGVILIVGMGGIGKTTLAQLVYNDESIRDRFGLQAWVCVSEEYDVFRLTKDMIEEVSRRPCDINSLNQLQLELKRILKGHRFLLILDDVWIDDVGTWEMLRMPFMSGAKGSKIIVTTRNQNVASLMGTRSIYSLNQLDTNDCWLLFAKQAFGDEFGEHPQLEVVGREIVRKCKGIPLAAKALGGLLHSERDIHKWEKVLNSNLWDLPSNKVLPALKLSYYYLPSHLKQCFAYCALFPADYEFKMDELILLWMAEGFVVQHEGNTDIEEIGEQYFHDLISRSLFQQSASDKSLVTMHDLIHDLAKYVSGEFCFRVDGSNSWTVSQMTRHLSLERTWSGPSSQFDAISKSPCLRTFLQLHRGPIDGEVLVNLLSTLKRLRVLSLSNYYLAADLFVSVGLLKHLRYLNLSGTPIERLFDSVGSLYNLQTLILNDCIKLSLLPDSIGNLINLCHLYNGETKLKEMPPQMGKLSRLRKLTDFYIGKGSGSTIKELGQLHHLHGSLTVWNLQFVDNVQDVCVANLKGKKCLKSLKLVWKGDTFDSLQERAVLEQLQPNKNLECLSIIGYGGTKFPSWLGDSLFSTITSVELRECKHCSSLPPFGQLVSLTSLSIVACDAVVTVGSEFYGSSPMRRDPFISLKTLRIEKMQQWQEWNTATDGSDIGAFPILEQLYLTDCPNLTKALPRKLPYLETLVIEGCQQLDMATIPSNQTTYKMHLVDDYRDVWLNRCAAVRPHHLEIARFFCQSPVEGMELVTGVSSSLEEIEICRSDSLVYFPLHMFPKLKTLSIRYSASLKHLSEAVDSTICREASSLDSLEVCNCPNLVSFPRGGLLAPNMTQLLLQSCSKLKSLPEERMLPSSLTSLEISDLHNLKFLNTRCFQQLASLGRLKIKNCPQLQYIREDKFPPSLHLLSIVMCPLLRQRFQPENGELWPMISHIRDVFIY
ncbi:Putative disease resistance RPP13-like protein 1 [Linum perenne]